MFNSTTKKAKPKGFNLFDGDTSSDDSEPPRAPTKKLPSCTDAATSSVPTQSYASLAAAENVMTQNFSAKPSNIPESKSPNVKDANAQHKSSSTQGLTPFDSNILACTSRVDKQEQIIPRSSVQPADYAEQFRQRFVRPYAHIILQQNQLITSGKYNMRDSGKSLSSQGSTHFDSNILASTSRVDTSQLRRGTTSSVKQQTDATPRQIVISGGDKLGIALYAVPGKGFSFKHKNGKIISIHKNVLAAQSPYFFQQFYGNPGSSVDTVLVDDFDPEVASLAVKACYQQPFDESSLDDRIAEQLYIFATKYDIGCVMALLPQTSKNIISADTVCSIALRSYESSDIQLRQKCAAFIASLITEGMQLPDEVRYLPADFYKAIVLCFVTKNKF